MPKKSASTIGKSLNISTLNTVGFNYGILLYGYFQAYLPNSFKLCS